jgi:hypothetical protein
VSPANSYKAKLQSTRSQGDGVEIYVIFDMHFQPWGRDTFTPRAGARQKRSLGVQERQSGKGTEELLERVYQKWKKVMERVYVGWLSALSLSGLVARREQEKHDGKWRLLMGISHQRCACATPLLL